MQAAPVHLNSNFAGKFLKKSRKTGLLLLDSVSEKSIKKCDAAVKID